MLTRFQLVGVALAVGIIWAVAAKLHPTEAIPGQATAEVDAETSITPEAEAARLATHERETKAYVQQLEQLAATVSARELAMTRQPAARKLLQFDRRKAWSNFLDSNRASYERLCEQAKSSPDGEAACSICGGQSNPIDCILCATANGKCVSCLGTGRHRTGEICPTCLGTGKCFLCYGSGHMPCPFCNDGMVDARRPAPPPVMPIE